MKVVIIMKQHEIANLSMKEVDSSELNGFNWKAALIGFIIVTGGWAIT